jgi:hypothetical protein
LQERVIVTGPEIMNGTPYFRGTRVPFKNLIDYLEGGHSLGEFLKQFSRIAATRSGQLPSGPTALFRLGANHDLAPAAPLSRT